MKQQHRAAASEEEERSHRSEQAKRSLRQPEHSDPGGERSERWREALLREYGFHNRQLLPRGTCLRGPGCQPTTPGLTPDFPIHSAS